MDEDKSSFLYLPSNVTSQRYVSNTPSHFKIPLAEPLNFCDPQNWEASLSELYFPSSHYNISQDNNMKEVNKEIKKSNTNSQQPVSQKYSLKVD